jgi:hypothetical protein
MFMHFSGPVRKEWTMFRHLQHKGHNAIIFPIIKQRKFHLSQWIIPQREWISRYQWSTTYIGTDARKEYIATLVLLASTTTDSPGDLIEGFITSGIQVTNKITILGFHMVAVSQFFVNILQLPPVKGILSTSSSHRCTMQQQPTFSGPRRCR